MRPANVEKSLADARDPVLSHTSCWLIVVATFAQWVGFIVLDVAVRAIFFFPFWMFAPFVSGLHIVIFALTSLAVKDLRYSPKQALVRSIAVTNVVFVVILVLLWVTMIRSGRESACEGYNFNCSWFEGVITWRGVGTIATVTLVQVAINVVVVLLVFGRDIRRGNVE